MPAINQPWNADLKTESKMCVWFSFDKTLQSAMHKSAFNWDFLLMLKLLHWKNFSLKYKVKTFAV